MAHPTPTSDRLAGDGADSRRAVGVRRQPFERKREIARGLEPRGGALLQAPIDDARERRREMWRSAAGSPADLPCRIAVIVSAAVSPRNARWPDSIS